MIHSLLLIAHIFYFLCTVKLGQKDVIVENLSHNLHQHDQSLTKEICFTIECSGIFYHNVAKASHCCQLALLCQDSYPLSPACKVTWL